MDLNQPLRSLQPVEDTRAFWYEAMRKTADRITALEPRLVFSLAERLARLGNYFGIYGPTSSQVRAVFPELAPKRLSEIRRCIAAQDFKYRLLSRLVRREGLSNFSKLV